MKAVVRNPDDGDIFVKDLNGKEMTLSAYGDYWSLGLCEKTWELVILRPLDQHIFIAQSIDFDVVKEEI